VGLEVMTVSHQALTEYFAPKSSTRCALIKCIFESQPQWSISQNSSGQVAVRIEREAAAPQWAAERDPWYTGRQLSQSVELCITGRESMSILCRVYRGSCYQQADWQRMSMKSAIEMLEATDPWDSEG